MLCVGVFIVISGQQIGNEKLQGGRETGTEAGTGQKKRETERDESERKQTFFSTHFEFP